MNVSFQNIDNVSARLTVHIEKADYQDKVEQSLKKLRKNVQMPGFRPGMVPMGLVKKMYGKSVKAEELDKLLNTATNDYIRNNHVKMLGEPLPEEHPAPMDLDTQEDYEFAFDLALAPVLGISVSADDHLPYYDIAVSDEAVSSRIDIETRQRGTYGALETFAPNALLTGKLTELDADGQPKEGGIVREKATMMPTYMKDADEKAKFEGIHVGDTVTVNPYTAWEGNQTELASLFSMDKEEAAQVQSNFTYEITSIEGLVPAPLDQKLFDDVCGEGKVNSEEEFRAYIKAQIEAEQQPMSDARLQEDVRKLLMAKAGRPQLADALLKRIMLERDKDKTAEEVDADYESSIEPLIWHLVKEELVEAYDTKVDDNDVLEEAKAVIRNYYAQYGPYALSEDFVEKNAKELLQKEGYIEGLLNRVIERKLTAHIKEVATLDRQTVSLAEFAQLNAAPGEDAAADAPADAAQAPVAEPATETPAEPTA